MECSSRQLRILTCIFILACTFDKGIVAKLSVTVPLAADFDSYVWRVHNANNSFNMYAAVPGSVHTVLMHNGSIGDPYYRFRDVEYRWIAYDNWTYYRSFTLKPDILNMKSLILDAEGLDTVANVSINGLHVGQSTNMFQRYQWNIKNQAKIGINNITISFMSAPTYALDQSNEYSYDVPPDCPTKYQHGICHMNFMRKEQCSFSWDWGPAFAPQGIWKNLTIKGFDAPLIENVLAIPLKNGSNWKMNVTVFFSVGSLSETDVASGYLTVTLPFQFISHIQIKFTKAAPFYNLMMGDFTLDDDQLWWPHGFGEQNLHRLNVTFETYDLSIISVKHKMVGFRTVKLVQEPIPNSPGLSFYFEINDRPIFIKGSNWIPADAFQERVTPERLRNLLQSLVDANMHALRVWGGGVYEQDEFYDICDELGIVLWQDIMFGCAMYPTNQEFLESAREEVRHQVRRIGYHPSLLIWAGNNENEAALRQDWYGTMKNFSLYKDDYIQLYISTIRDEINHHMTNIPFVSSSPSNGEETASSGWIALNPQDNHYGDVHYYNYVDDCWDLSKFPNPRFASEYGFQSWPSLETLKGVSIKEDWDLGSNFSYHRQHHMDGNLQMMSMIQKHFNIPEQHKTAQSFGHVIYLTQISQAMCIKFETEHYRRLQSLLVKSGEGHCMGALYWQLNDIWQAPTWASIEYGGNWKMLHYFAKDFFAPILASGMEENGQLYVYTITDGDNLSNASLVVTLRKWESMNFSYTWTKKFSQKAPSSQLVFQHDTKKLLQEGGCQDRNACFFTFQVFQDKKRISPTNPFYLTSFKDAVGLKSSQITVQNISQKSKTSFSIQLKSTEIAPFTWLEVTNPSPPKPTNPSVGRFSDNGFLFLEPEITVEFFPWQPISLEDFKKSLMVTSLMDLYSQPLNRYGKLKWQPEN